jgi:anti-sigma-K factor RskA
MTREQIEAILKTAQATKDKEGGHALPEGSNVTFHVAHDGASVSIQKIEGVRFDGEILYAKSAKQTVALIASDVYAVAVEGGGGSPPRRPAGFL